MTLHIGKKDYKCESCGVIFIPYGPAPMCPNCDAANPVSKEYADFIADCARSLIINRHKGSYVPGTWYIGCFSDFVQNTLFTIFNQIEKAQPTYAAEYVDMQWEEVAWEPFQKKHIEDIFTKVYAELKREPRGIRERLLRLRGKWCGDFLPAFDQEPESLTSIKIPTTQEHWYGLDVVAIRGPKNTLLLFTVEAYEKVVKKIAATQKEGMEDYIRMGSVECRIDSEGNIALPDFLIKHLQFNGSIQAKDEPGMMTIEKSLEFGKRGPINYHGRTHLTYEEIDEFYRVRDSGGNTSELVRKALQKRREEELEQNYWSEQFAIWFFVCAVIFQILGWLRY